jgi:uncharacterized repeat protein (TIGR01451 family)
MKARETFVLALVVSLALVPVLASAPVRAQGQYTERIDVYTAGSSAYWLMTMDRLNGTLTGLSSAEASSGASSYRLVALSSQSLSTDLQVFGVDGYNVLGVPSLPSQGIFLTVNASSSSSASALANYFSGRFATSFTLVSSGSGSFVFFAPVGFSTLAAPVLYRLVPTTMKGYASFLTEPSFSALPVPAIELYGENNGSGFSHTIVIGAAASSVLSSAGAISIPQILSRSGSTLTSSSSASSSEVVVHSLDGVIQSTDKASVSNDASSLTGTYTLSPNAGSAVRANVTITSQAPTAIAYRIFDRGTVSTNQSLAVTVVVKDTASTGSIQNVTVNDVWWQSFPSVFQFVSGNYSFRIPIITAGQNATESYVLRVVSSSSSQVTVPSADATFQYVLSSASYTSRAALNQAVLQVNGVGPAVSIVARSTLASGAPLGSAGNFTLTLTNSGNSPALSIRVGGLSISNLAEGSSQTLNVPIALSSLVQRNFTKTFSVQFTDASQKTQNITSNSVSVLLSHSSMSLPLVQLTTNDTLTSTSISSRLLNVTYSFSNKGTAASGAVTGTQALPSGVSCKVVKGNGTCSAGIYSLKLTGLATQKTVANTVELSFSQDNFLIPPPTVSVTYEGATLHAFGGAYVVPAGLSLTKSFGLTGGFPGMTTSVVVGIVNKGTTPVYNATVSSGADIFDSLASSAPTFQTYATLAPQQSESFNYTVKLSSATSGNSSSSPATVQFVQGGVTTTLSSGNAFMQIYKPVSAAVTVNPPAPEENHDFTMAIAFTNSAPVSVSAVTFTMPLPSGISVVSGGQVSGGTLSVTLPTLGPGANQTVDVTMTASTGLTLQTSSSHVAFQYAGSSLTGVAPKQAVTVGVDVTTRYTIPIIIAVFIAIAGLVYVRRRINPAVES